MTSHDITWHDIDMPIHLQLHRMIIQTSRQTHTRTYKHIQAQTRRHESTDRDGIPDNQFIKIFKDLIFHLESAAEARLSRLIKHFNDNLLISMGVCPDFAGDCQEVHALTWRSYDVLSHFFVLCAPALVSNVLDSLCVCQWHASGL